MEWRGFPSGDRGDIIKPQKIWEKMERDIEGFVAVLDAIDNRNKYITINQDEPYANAVWDIIIAFENMKEKLRHGGDKDDQNVQS